MNSTCTAPQVYGACPPACPSRGRLVSIFNTVTVLDARSMPFGNKLMCVSCSDYRCCNISGRTHLQVHLMCLVPVSLDETFDSALIPTYQEHLRRKMEGSHAPVLVSFQWRVFALPVVLAQSSSSIQLYHSSLMLHYVSPRSASLKSRRPSSMLTSISHCRERHDGPQLSYAPPPSRIFCARAIALKQERQRVATLSGRTRR